MKKIRVIVVLFILTFSFSVKAMTFIRIDCDSKKITSEKGASCSGVLIFDSVVEDIDFVYQTNLDISFVPVSNLSLTTSGNKISIHPETPLKVDFLGTETIFKFNLSANKNNKQDEKVTFKNISINKNSDEIIMDASETFEVEVPQVLDSDALLTSITIDKISISGFDKNKFEYPGITVNKDVVFIDAVRSSDKSSATGLGQIYAPAGETIEHIITVTAEDKTIKEYKLYITNKNTASNVHDIPTEVPKNEVKQETEVEEKSNTTEKTNPDVLETIKELSKDNTLKSLELFDNKEKINFTFDSNKEKYDIKLSNGTIEKLTIKAELNDKNATFVSGYGPRDIKLDYGDNKVLIRVKAENNDEKTYTLNINRLDERDNDTSLASLKINDNEINLVNKVYKYEIKVNKDISKTSIEAKANSEKSTVKYQDIELNSGDNKVTITVTAENGDKKDYIINVIKSDEEIIDTVLENIEIDGYIFDFDKDKKNYVLKLDDDTKEVTIIVKPSNIKYEIIGNNNLDDGSVITIKVNDDNYYITIEKNSNSSILIYLVIILLVIVIVIGIIIKILKKKKKKDEIEII